MPTKKFVLRRKYKEYLDPTAKDWYNSIFDTKVIRDWTTAWNLNPMTEKQERINTADSIEKVYRNRAKRYIQGRKERESNPNFVGPVIPISIKTLPSTIKESIGMANRAEGDHPLDYDTNHTTMITRDAHWPEKGWQEGATVTYPIDTLYNIYPTNRHPDFVHYKLGGNLRKKALNGIEIARLGSNNFHTGLPVDATNTVIIPQRDNFIPGNRNFWQKTGMTPWDLAGAGVQFVGNLTSSLINQGAIDRLKFTPIHTTTIAEAPVKFNTNYNINPQLSNLRESLGSVEREVTNNSASSRNRIGRITNSRFRGIGAYNELYGHKLNQETAMLNADAQNRQGVYARNAARLQQNIARDTAYNTQGQDNLDNTKTTLTGQNWTNFTQNTADSLIQAYNRGQHRLSDATSLAYFLARDNDAAKIFTGKENPTFNDIWNHAYYSFGIPVRKQAKLGCRSSLIRK